MRILLTTTSYQDTPGRHHTLLEDSGFEVVRGRGPLPEADVIRLIETHGGFDGLLNGDDHITARVIDAALAAPTPLRVICKYGIGLDSIDMGHATTNHLPVLFTPGVNHTTVAEHAIGLMIAASKHFWVHLRSVKEGGWHRQTGHELAGKTLAILGMGRVGKEVARRAAAFGMELIGFDPCWDEPFAAETGVRRCETIGRALREADVVTLHLPATDQTREMINADSIASMKDGVVIVNTARGALIDENAVAEACRCGKIMAYATDVLIDEPPRASHPFQDVDNILVTPHIGSRTYESVERQAMRATLNLVNYLNGGDDYLQANPLSPDR
jgi:D-3-phosphoglycerate dehydrogenase / 2-oxoglutarate reductase